MFPTFEIFCQVMDQCTENFECLVIDNTTKSNKLEDTVFWYKADSRPSFRVCQDEYWVLSNNIKDTDEDQEEMFDPSNIKKRQHIINVKKV
jgi:hypothetical protein